LIVGPAVFDRYILALDEACLQDRGEVARRPRRA
jgi:hypothetical protein